jgi:hypothetical protein
MQFSPSTAVYRTIYLPLQLPVAMERKAKRRNRREQQKLEEREGHEEGGQEHERLHVATSSLLGRTSSAAAWPLRHPYLPSAHRGGGDRRRGGSGRRTVAPPLFCFSAGEQPGLPLLSCGNTMPPPRRRGVSGEEGARPLVSLFFCAPT